MDKSPEAFRTISEVADFLDTPAHVLRFWESRFPQIRPVKRAGGRRYYRPADVALLAGIKKLLHDDGVTIRGVQKILREHGIRHVANLASEDAGTELDDTDIEAVLSAEYGPRDRLPNDEPASSEALQSAQIISLETALNRQDGAREANAVEPLLWPPADLDNPSAAGETVSWPGDPGDREPITDASEPTEPISAEGTPESNDVAALQTDNDPFAEQSSANAQRLGAAASELVPPLGGSGRTPIDEQSAETGLDHMGDSSTSSGENQADSHEPLDTTNIAALLRRTSPDSVSAVRPQLIQLRYRLIDLRERVAEAARRKAK